MMANRQTRSLDDFSARDIDRNHDWVNESLLRYPEIEEAESFIQQAIGLPMVCRRLLHQNRYLQLLEYHPQQIMKDEPLIEKEELYKIVEKAGNEALKTEKFQKMGAQDKISNIFEQTYKILVNWVNLINILVLNSTSHNKFQIAFEEIQLDLENIDINKLTWKNPIASQVISDDSDIIKNSLIGAYQFFMKLAKQMQIDSLPNIIQEECNQFLNDFKEENLNLLCNKYKYNNTWIESNEKLCEITKEILNTL
ncbi:unnamed protein product [Rhizophagus irregularis]|nr:unnamed protein product [Rhizophagus irregularis]